MVEKVVDDLTEAVGIAHHRHRERIDHLRQADPLAVGRRAQRVDGGRDDAAYRDGLHVETQLAGDDAADVEEVFHQLHLQVHVAVDDLEPMHLSILGEPAAAQEAGPSEHRVETRQMSA